MNTHTHIELIKRENNSPKCREEKEVTSSPCSTKGHGESTGQVHTRFSAARSRLLLATQGSPRSRSRGPCPFGDTTSSKKNYIKPLDLSLSNTTRYVLLNAATEALEKATSQRRRATATTPRPQNSAASQQRSNAASQHRSPDSCVRARSGRSVW